MRRRRRIAPGGRVLATGLGVSATFGIVAGLAAEAQPTDPPAPVPATQLPAGPTPTTIVTHVVERTIYVPAGGTSSRSSGGGGRVRTSSSSGGGGGGSAPAAAPAPSPAPAPPVCSGSKC
jgi:hypothetical protein